MVKVKKKRFSKVFNLCNSWIKLNVRQCYFLTNCNFELLCFLKLILRGLYQINKLIS